MPHEWLTALEINNVEGDASRGGYTASVSFYNAQEDVPTYRELSLYHLNFSNVSWESDHRTAMKGVIIPQSISVDRGTSIATASVCTFHQPLSDIPVSGCYFEDSAAGNNAHQINNLSLGLVVKHLAEHHVTVTPDGIDTTQIDTAGSTTITPYIVRQNASLWAAMKKVASDEFYAIYFDRQNRLVYKCHPQFAGAPPAAVATLDDDNLMAPYMVEFRTGRKAKNVILLGLNDDMEVLESTYPAGAGVDVRGPRFEIRCNTQARLDVLAERQYKWLNRDYTATLTLLGAWNFELYDHVKVTLEGTTTNGATFSWTDKSFWVHRVNYRKETQGAHGYITELILEEGYV